MNHNSLLHIDSGCLWPYTGSQEDQDDIQRLLESPTALATQYNDFSSRLGGLETLNDGDPLRQNSLVHSPDFTPPVAKGSLVWAKFPKFPWWPAVIIGNTPPSAAAAAAGATASGPSSKSFSTATDTSSDTSHHQQHHQQQQQPGYTPGAALVRFLGTHDAAWVEPGKALSRWGVAQHERASKTKAASFVAALREAGKYLETGALPEAFHVPPHLVVPPTPSSSSRRRHKQAKPSQAATNTPATEQQQQQQHLEDW
ncbi:hypothetical protein OEZ86_000893 [Tetradesmus obliquus]|nr:hypothetical protein OEZ86_000893 [Tetradesmus obliquus]